jgi:DNA-binding IclR family transcriptional regulator
MEEDSNMSHTYEELKHKTVVELREIAKGIEHEAVQGATQMNKDHLLKALCTALGIEAHAHHVVVGIDKVAIKGKIRELKKRRDEILVSKNLGELHGVLRQIHAFKRRIRRAMV